MLMLSSVLRDENSPIHVRNAAGLALKNALSARVRPHILDSFTQFSLDFLLPPFSFSPFLFLLNKERYRNSINSVQLVTLFTTRCDSVMDYLSITRSR